MLRINNNISIDENEINEHFILSDGPGGQHVNKTASAVKLRFDFFASPNLPETVKIRLEKIAGKMMTKDGEIIITAKSHRSQYRNREEALERLIDLIRKAATPPKRRRQTRRTKASNEKRLERKRRRGKTKKDRSFSKRDII